MLKASHHVLFRNVSSEPCCQFAFLICLISSQLKYFQSNTSVHLPVWINLLPLTNIQRETLLITPLSIMNGSIVGMQTDCGSSHRAGRWWKAFLDRSASLPAGKVHPLWGRPSCPSQFTSGAQSPLPSASPNADEENLTAHEQHASPICNSRFKTVPVRTAWRCTGQIRLQNGNQYHKGSIHLDNSLLPCLDLEFKSPVL